MSKEYIAMDNALVSGKWALEINELRLIGVILSQIPDNTAIDPKKPYYITKKDFVNLGVEPKNVTRDIRLACSNLMDRKVFIPTPLGDLETRWVHHVLHFKSDVFEELKKKYPSSKYDEEFINSLRMHNLLNALSVLDKSNDNVMARVVLHEDIIPYISDLKSCFTTINLMDIFSLSGLHSARIYILLLQWKSKNTQNLSFSHLKEHLGLQDKYPSNKDFIKRVIEPAIQEISEKTAYFASAEPEKTETNRFTGNIKFKFHIKEKAKQVSSNQKRDPDTIDLIAKMTDKQRFTFASKLSEMPEMGKYSHGTESYQQFAIRIADMLLDPEKRKELAPYLVKAGFNEKP